jgi:hypothetical protein
MEGSGLWLNLRYYTGICIEGLGKAATMRCQNSRCPSRDSNQSPSKQHSETLQHELI